MPNEPEGRAVLEDAVILHRRPYRETSLLLDAFSNGQGRLRLLAKGAKRGSAARAHVLRCFVPLRLSWLGRGELPVLTGAELGGDPVPLEGTALYCGLYLNELLLRLLPDRDPCPEVFLLYLDTLDRLATAASPEAALRRFESGLLSHIGYGLALDREAVTGRPIDPAQSYDYLIEQGGPVPAQQPGPDSVQGSTLLALSRDGLDDPHALREAKRLLRRVIGHHLNGRALKSRDLFKQPGNPRIP